MASDDASASRTSETVATFDPATPQKSLIFVNMSNITKLSHSNYITWSIQVRSLLEAHNLICFIDDTLTVPSATVIADGISVDNPAFAPWKQQDRMLFSTLLGTIVVELQPLIVRSASSDELALLGKPMDHEDVLEAILDGLPEEFKPVIDVVQARDTAISISELHEKLLNHEAKLHISASVPSAAFPVSAHAVDTRTQQQHRFGPRPPYRSAPRPMSRQDHRFTPRGSAQHSRPRGYQGRCQACGTVGHSASRCYQFNLVAASGSSPGSASWSPSPRSWQPRAHAAVHSSYEPDQWLLDSGASHHITTDLHNLAIHNPYSGGEDVVVGDGSSHPITHTGSISIPTSSRSVHLDDVLCVPGLCKNLVSVNKLCSTNDVSVVFSSSGFQVKDRITGAPILRGRSKDGVYEWPLSGSLVESPQALSCSQSTLSEWHLRLVSSRVFVSRHVQFHETVFPFSGLTSQSSPSSVEPVSSSPVAPFGRHVTAFQQPLVASSPVQSPGSGSSPPDSLGLCDSPALLLPADGSARDLDSCPTPADSVSADLIAPESVDVDASVDCVPRNTHPMQTRSKNNILMPNPRYTLMASVADTSDIEPSSVTQAIKDPNWRAAMTEEFQALCRNNTWDLVPSSDASNVVGCRWVFRIKRKPDGSVDRYKARLVAKGFHQRPGVDYHETFSPVVKPTTIRVVLSLAVSRGWTLRQLDVNNAFLQGNLSEEVYMSQPPGFIDHASPQLVCKLRKAIYGLKQAPRAWYSELRHFLLQSGFQNSVADASLFILHMGPVQLFVLVYVDDLIITGSCSTHLEKFISDLAARFFLKDLGMLSYFLGVEASRSDTGILLTQRKYIGDILSRARMSEAKPVATPMAASSRLTVVSGSALSEPTEYRAIVGSLQYLSLTRPDISFAVNKLSQFMHSPTDEHCHPISWSSKKQKGLSRSSTEAEYRSVASTAAEVCWVGSLLSELGCPSPSAPVIYCDNLGATYLSANPVFHSRMKHIALDYLFVRGLVESGDLRVAHISAADQLADALTKPLPGPPFLQLRVKIGVTSGAPS
ncbi:PREDICTED: uncharacterized protein LOC104807900 [Tarenaya hassleriana]|uniref:uncharacterized protein LOC104807900 n=1 Tax=Tarenaya hassleriana TaxID=28532 RepID=UPI00053C9F4D|nr:PREDICTED: uncharacterized protein LOC104807900 [Tarenaya hassleriana]